MSIGLSFSKLVIFLKIFNYEIKSNSSMSNKLSCFKHFSRFKLFFFKNEICTYRNTQDICYFLFIASFCYANKASILFFLLNF